MIIKINKTILEKVYKKRPKDAKKYDFGFLLVIGGSKLYTGAPALSAMAGFRAGVDMVRIIAPKRVADIVSSFSPNLSAYGLEGDWLAKDHLTTLISITESAKMVANGNTAVVIGGGMGRDEETQEVVKEYLGKINIPAVIDADAIYAIAEKKEILKGKPFLITPHSYEFFILTGRDLSNYSFEEKLEIVREEAEKLGTTILLKGELDIISDGKRVAVDSAGCSYMTTGGTGDVMAGICGALMAKGIDVFDAACAGAYINGKAGEKMGQIKKDGMVATDLIETIPDILN